ncbi:MAG: DUF3883 domain-containing protein [Synergistaceae bacterium]|nr:DUF3883 domain-containing protein [Synergistaceae bacterium]
MLEELKNYNNIGCKKDILYFLQKIIANRLVSTYDILTFCSHAPGEYSLHPEALVCFCRFSGLIESHGEMLSLSPNISKYMDDEDKLTTSIVSQTLRASYSNHIFSEDHFSFDLPTQKYIFNNDKLAFKWSLIRNVLKTFDFMYIDPKYYQNKFFISSQFLHILHEYHKEYRKAMTLERLKKEIERNAEVGELAEHFAYLYEQNRFTNFEKAKYIKLISELDVCAGYDMISFESEDSQDYDRFIEVKALSKEKDFYWSKNEIETAKYKGKSYYLYLVEISKIKEKSYVPWIIRNPANFLFKSDDWSIEPQSYHLKYTLLKNSISKQENRE